jgi:hypothetical protein
MPLLEDQTAAFVVRIWREQGELPSSSPEWRGSVEHVESGQKAFFRNFATMVEFMKPYLENFGVDPSQRFWELLESWGSLTPEPGTNGEMLKPPE